VTQPQDPRKQPLQDDEVALARVLRALPSGEPPASVDDAILRAATDAIAPGRRKPAGGLRWLPTWAIGTAAAAVLAVGIGLQLRPPLVPDYPAASVEQKTPLRPEARERMDVDLVEPERAPAPPPASTPPSARQSSSGRPPPPPPPSAAPMAPPAPAPVPEPMPQALPAEAAAPALADQPAPESGQTLDSIEVSGTRIRSEASDQARRAHQENYARRAQAKAGESERSATAADRSAPAAALAEADAAVEADGAAAPAGVSGAFIGAAAVLPPVADDAQLSQADWLERIRERRRQGDTASARASLRLFLQAYPEAPVPSDLARLR
jgi:hypothetical protein